MASSSSDSDSENDASNSVGLDSPAEDNDSEENTTPPPKVPVVRPKPATKPKPKTMVPACAPSSQLAHEGHAVSAKKKEMDKEADRKKIALLEKKLAKANKLVGAHNDVAETSRNPNPPILESGPQRKDPEDEETLVFSSSIISLPTVSAGMKVKAPPANSAASKSSISHRTFLTIPDGPRSSLVSMPSSPSPSPSPHIHECSTTTGNDSTTTNQQSNSSHSKQPPSTSILAPSAKKKKSHMAILPQTAPFQDSYIDGSGRPKSSDSSDVVEALLLCSMHEYEALISATDAFPSGTFQTDWVWLCWKNTTNATNEHFEISDRMG
ncbi:hypothetical protein BYT27DRAFT_7262751 [Phlegmacium glaucopus]|nr:hypothetical protein BYT27DRAFT_7262751 [Phlegmacium glaucopus]